jgi:hypothetical protein
MSVKNLNRFNSLKRLVQDAQRSDIQLNRHIKTLTDLFLPPATGEGWDGGDARVIDVASNANNPPSQPSPISMGEGADCGFGSAPRATQSPAHLRGKG